MYCVIIKENIEDNPYRQQLYFHFNTKEEATHFANIILDISNYIIEILPPLED